jgi:hypothetical protein
MDDNDMCQLTVKVGSSDSDRWALYVQRAEGGGRVEPRQQRYFQQF